MKKTAMKLCVMAIFVFNIQGAINAQEKQENTNSSPKMEVKKIDAVKAVVIKATVASKEIGPKMGELYGKLFAYLGQKQIQPAGAPFAVYYTYDPNGNTTFEAGVPVNSAIKCDGDVAYKEYPEMQALTTLYVGAYENMAPIYVAIEKYMKDKKLESTGICWEVYLTDPKSVSDPEKNQTCIYFPIK